MKLNEIPCKKCIHSITISTDIIQNKPAKVMCKKDLRAVVINPCTHDGTGGFLTAYYELYSRCKLIGD